MIKSVDSVDYTAHGIRRGGNHAIINWILLHFDSSIFYNCCNLEGDKVFVHEHDLVKRGGNPYKVYLASFEDQPEIIDKVESIFGQKTILIIRDFYNTYASRFEKRREVKSIHALEKKWNLYDDDVCKWKKLALKFLDNDQRFIKINYNMWFYSQDYRRRVSCRFGKFSDKGIKEVSHFGGGSSFDQMKYNGKANDMNVMKRWINYYRNDEYAKKILTDEEARELNREIFGFSAPRIHL